MGKEELIQYFEDAIALETAVITQENFISQFEAMSKNKKPVLVERKVQVAEPDPNGLDSETNVVTFFLVANTVIFSFAQLVILGRAAEPSFSSLIAMTIFDGIILAIYLPERNGNNIIQNRDESMKKIVKLVGKKTKREEKSLLVIKSVGRIPAQK